MQNVFLEGLLLQASLIFALGAQNIFVLESGLNRNYPLIVCITCFVCDLILIMLGVAGAGTVFTHYPQIKILIGIIGVLFLFYYGLDKLISKNQEFQISRTNDYQKGLRRSVLESMTFSVINPHAYLDGIVLIGGYSAKYSFLSHRLILGLGAATYSLLWFLILSFAAMSVMPLLKNKTCMKWLMSLSGILLIYLSVSLSYDVFDWVAEMAHNPNCPSWATACQIAMEE